MSKLTTYRSIHIGFLIFAGIQLGLFMYNAAASPEPPITSTLCDSVITGSCQPTVIDTVSLVFGVGYVLLLIAIIIKAVINLKNSR